MSAKLQIFSEFEVHLKSTVLKQDLFWEKFILESLLVLIVLIFIFKKHLNRIMCGKIRI